MLLKVSLNGRRDVGNMLIVQAFVGRLPSLQDLSAHHASSDHSVPEGGVGTGEAFREGMEGDERECQSFRCVRGEGCADSCSILGWAGQRQARQELV